MPYRIDGVAGIVQDMPFVPEPNLRAPRHHEIDLAEPYDFGRRVERDRADRRLADWRASH
jgi:hypothetical protein